VEEINTEAFLLELEDFAKNAELPIHSLKKAFLSAYKEQLLEEMEEFGKTLAEEHKRELLTRITKEVLGKED